MLQRFRFTLVIFGMKIISVLTKQKVKIMF